jgi:hypothetical protein
MNLHNVYLISESVLKKRSLITDPTLSVYIKPAIECAQKIGLRGIIGDCLLEKLQYLVVTKNEEGTGILINEDEYAHYKDLLNNYITDYLCYATMSEAVIPYRDKMRNAGIVNTVDTNYQQPAFSEVQYVKRFWNDKCEYFGTRLREYIVKNISWFPEYKCNCECGDNGGKLDKTYHCGIVI